MERRIVDLPLIIEIDNLKQVDTDFSPELLFSSITGVPDIQYSDPQTHRDAEPLWVEIDTVFNSFPTHCKQPAGNHIFGTN